MKTEIKHLETAIKNHDHVLREQSSSLKDLTEQIRESNKITQELVSNSAANDEKFLNITNLIVELQRKDGELQREDGEIRRDVAKTNQLLNALTTKAAINSYARGAMSKLYIQFAGALLVACTLVGGVVYTVVDDIHAKKPAVQIQAQGE